MCHVYHRCGPFVERPHLGIEPPPEVGLEKPAPLDPMQKSRVLPKDDVGAWSGCPFGLRNDLKRQNVDGAPGDKFGFLRVTREKSPCLKRFDGLIIHGGCEVIVIRAALHTTIRDFSLSATRFYCDAQRSRRCGKL